MRTPPSLKVGGEIVVQTQPTLNREGLFIRRVLVKEDAWRKLLLVYLLQKEPTFEDGGVMLYFE